MSIMASMGHKRVGRCLANSTPREIIKTYEETTNYLPLSVANQTGHERRVKCREVKYAEDVFNKKNYAGF